MKVAFVVQRYGQEVNGGAEYYCRLLAEHLAKHVEVTVLTTCALDYMEWQNHYADGLTVVNGIPVRRFKVERARDVDQFNRFSEKMLAGQHSNADELEWMDLQGPYCPDLMTHIRQNAQTYDLFVFFTYLYYTTFHGLPMVAHKSLLIPTAHDEWPIRFRMFKTLFTSPQFMVFSTRAERDFVHQTFNNRRIPHALVGIGVEVPANINADGFRNRYRIRDPFLLYVGRIDESKGCKELFEYFARYKRQASGNLKLVLIGKAVMELPEHADVIPLGFVSEDDKFGAIGAAELMIVPSPYESLSMVSLEGWMAGKSLMVNGSCAVLRDNCVMSNGGLFYANYEEFAASLEYLLRNPDVRERMGHNGRAYVEANYRWPLVEEKFMRILREVSDAT